MVDNAQEGLELLKAALAMAAVDGRITGSEKALLKAIAQRAGVGAVSLEAMIQQVLQAPDDRDELFSRAIRDPERAMQLLVAAAQIDGRICEPERNLLVDVSFALGVSAHRFNHIFQAGLAAANRVRARPQ